MSNLITKRAADVAAQPLSWLWPLRIPRGKVTLLAGDPGLGKSFLTTDIAARVTRAGSERGDWPDGPGPLRHPGDVLFLNAEDDPADTIRPRLERAGADLRRIHFVGGVMREGRGGRPDWVALDQDCAAIATAVKACERPRLIVIDPISAYMGQTDANSNAEVRGVLARLGAIAQETGVAVLCVTHLAKSSSQNGSNRAVYRAMGSLAFTAAARMVWFVSTLPDDPKTRVMTLVKCNICPRSSALTFDIHDAAVRWLDTNVQITADELESDDRGREGMSIPEAADFLRAVLADGPVLAREVIARAREAGISEASLKRARVTANVRSTPRGRKGIGTGVEWVWMLGDADTRERSSPAGGGA